MTNFRQVLTLHMSHTQDSCDKKLIKVLHTSLPGPDMVGREIPSRCFNWLQNERIVYLQYFVQNVDEAPCEDMERCTDRKSRHKTVGEKNGETAQAK